MRVLVHVTDKSPHWIQACRWSTSCDPQNDLALLAIRLIGEEKLYDVQRETPDTRLLAIQKYRARIFVVLDVSNKDYDAKLGHFLEQKQNNLPVIVVHFSRQEAVYKANPGQSENVNRDVAHLHDCNGDGSIPPFIEDHTLESPPEYPNPRSLRRN